ncbi:MAG TPA: hypothetical protein PLD77_00050 [Candidatus Dojkabacteria bacterium]|nr:hypothetical protein [Candidatus Dojkabacteria bacterium]
MTKYILIFLLFSFLGWIVDTTYSSLLKGQYKPSGYYENIPICPIYGIGGIIILSIFSILQSYPPQITIITTTFAIIMLEYFGGIFCTVFLKEKLWDYSSSKFNIGGHIDLLHSFFWLVLITIVYMIIDPILPNITTYLNTVNNSLGKFDFYITVVFLSTVIIMTINTREKRSLSIR